MSGYHRPLRNFGFISSLLDPLTSSIDSAIASANKGALDAQAKVALARTAIEQAKIKAKQLKLKPEHWRALETAERKFQDTLNKIDAVKFNPERTARASRNLDFLFILGVVGLLGSVIVLTIIMRRKRKKKEDAEAKEKKAKEPETSEDEYEYVEVAEGEDLPEDDEYEYVEVAEGEDLPEDDEYEYVEVPAKASRQNRMY